jgi:hypothetical protein
MMGARTILQDLTRAMTGVRCSTCGRTIRRCGHHAAIRPPAALADHRTTQPGHGPGRKAGPA